MSQRFKEEGIRFKMVDISFIVPVYNTSKYLSDCFSSIMSLATDIKLEVIATDDCSTDDSYIELQKIRSQYDNIYIIRNLNNRGVSYSRNIGIEKSNGKYISFVDSDDVIIPSQFIKMYNNLRKSDANCAMGNLTRNANNDDTASDSLLIIKYTSDHVFTPNHVVGGYFLES